MADSSQKFIARNRAPRVQIEYDVELYGAEKKVQLPFVMGVMSDLSGRSPRPAVEERKFLEIDADNFDDRMKAVAPRAAFSVPNTLTGEGNLEVDLTFEKMDDFSPGAIAARVEALRPLLEARTRLQTLMAYMDGKAGAEALIERVLADPSLLGAVSGGDFEAEDTAAALQSLRAAMPVAAPEADATTDVLDALRSQPVPDAGPDTSVEDALASIPEVEVVEEVDDSADVLAELAVAAPEEAGPDTAVEDALASIPEVEIGEAVDDSADVLAGLADAAPEEAGPDTAVDDALASVPEVELVEAVDDSADVLAGLADAAPDEAAPDTSIEDALSSVPEVEVAKAMDDSADVLADLADAAPEEAAPDTSVEDALASIPEVAVVEEVDDSADVLAELADAVPEEVEPDTAVEDALASVPEVEVVEEVDDSADVLADLADAVPEEVEPDTAVEDALSSVPEVEVVEEVDDSADVLAELADAVPEEVEPDTSIEDALSSVPEVEVAKAMDDSADVLADLAETVADEAAPDTMVEDALASIPEVEVAEAVDDSADLLAGLDEAPTDETSLEEIDDPDDLLADGDDAEDLDALLGEASDTDPETDALEDLLDDLTEEEGEAAASDGSDLDDPSRDDDGETDDDLDDLLAGASEEDESEADDDLDAILADGTDDLDALLDDLGGIGAELEAAAAGEAPEDDTDLDDLLAGLDGGDEDDLDDLLAGLGEDDAAEGAEADEPALDDLNDLLADLAGEEGDDLEEDAPAEDAEDDDIDSLLADLESDGSDEPLDLDALLADDDGDADVDLDALLDEGADTDGEEAEMADDSELAFGTMGAARPQIAPRRRFRIALFGDFSGRAGRGLIETGDALAARPAILLDPDTVEDVIEGFGTTLVLPIGKDGAGIEVTLKELDDLHPDELYEKVELFSGLAALKGQLGAGATAESAAAQLRNWAETYGRKAAPPRRKSAGNTVRADLKLSDFQKLIGDSGGALTQASPLDDLLARVVGPHVRALPDPDVTAMREVIDEALSDAMRLVLHHPEFQSVEAQWRSLDLIARSVEVDDTLEVILHDVSAEEIAADLASADDLAGSGLVRLLTDGPLDEENGRGGYSALIGLYTFEETPPHAELLGRIARVAAHVDAPFIAAITPGYLEVDKKDRHPLVAEAWDTLRAMPEAGHLALASPRFLLRRPYGAKTEPIYEFDFEEFTMAEGLRGMLWANPAVLVTILLAQSFRKNGASMQLGSVMSLGGMPYHYVTDAHGDQVALPCTERNLSLAKHEFSVQRGYMPVLSVKGRDEIRLGSFNSLAGAELLGPWSGVAPPEPSPPKPAPPPAATEDEEDAPEIDAGAEDDDDLGDLDSLLAGFDDDTGDEDGGDDDLDDELAALLADL